MPGASVAEIARRYGANANLVFTWRRAALAAVLGPDETAALLVMVAQDETEDQAVVRTVAATGWRPRVINNLIKPIIIVNRRGPGSIVYDIPKEF